MGPWQQLAWQGWLACIGAWTWLWVRSGGKPDISVSPESISLLAVRAIGGRVCRTLFFILACRHTTLANVAWISSLPIAVLWGVFLHRERVSSWQMSLLLVGISGAACIAGPSFSGTEGTGLGEIFALLSVVAIGLGSTVGKSVVVEHGIGKTLVWTLFFTAVAGTLGVIVFDGGFGAPAPSRYGIMALSAVMVLLNTFCLAYGFTHLSSGMASAIVSLESV
jgi:drug/metabolite transporter (DMT)-like permease